MKPNTVHAIYFSPAHSTRTVVRAVAQGISDETINHDITQELKQPLTFSRGDLVVIGVPSYSGRVPVTAAERLGSIRANGAAAILVCVYGNREYEDTLVELRNICIMSDFTIVSAGAFIARHSIFPQVAQGRPDREDLAQARQFGTHSLEFIPRDETKVLNISGHEPYRAINAVPLKPRVNSRCTACGTCVALCPVGAIDSNNPRKTDNSRCISCAGCIEVCPQKARNFVGVVYKIAQTQFSKKYGRRKEIELFFPDTTGLCSI